MALVDAPLVVVEEDDEDQATWLLSLKILIARSSYRLSWVRLIED